MCGEPARYGVVGTRASPGRRRAVWGLCVLCWMAGVPSGSAAGPRSQTVTVLAIRATRSNHEVSPELRSIAQALRRQFRYTGYKLVRRQSAPTPMGKTVTADLGNGFKALVTPTKRDKTRVELRLKVTQREGKKDKPRLETTVRLPPGRYYLVGGWKYVAGSDDVLIVAVAAR